MKPSPRLAAAARLISLLAVVIGVLAMHTLGTGHHGDAHEAGSGAASIDMTSTAPGAHSYLPAAAPDDRAAEHLCDGACLHADPEPVPHPIGHWLDVCIAIVLAAATAGLLARYVRARPPRQVTAAGGPSRLIEARLSRVNALNLCQLGILRT